MPNGLGDKAQEVGKELAGSIASSVLDRAFNQAQGHAELMPANNDAKFDFYIRRRDKKSVELLLTSLFRKEDFAGKLSIYAYIFLKNGHHFSISRNPNNKDHALALFMLSLFGFNINTLLLVEGVFPVIASILVLHYVAVIQKIGRENQNDVLLSALQASLDVAEEQLQSAIGCGCCIDADAHKLHELTGHLSVVHRALSERLPQRLLSLGYHTLKLEEIRRLLLKFMVETLGDLFLRPDLATTKSYQTVGSLPPVEMPFKGLDPRYLGVEEGRCQNLQALTKMLFSFKGMRKQLLDNCQESGDENINRGLAWWHATGWCHAYRMLFEEPANNPISVESRRILAPLKEKIMHFARLSLCLELLAELSRQPVKCAVYIHKIRSFMEKAGADLKSVFPVRKARHLQDTRKPEVIKQNAEHRKASKVVDLALVALQGLVYSLPQETQYLRHMPQATRQGKQPHKSPSVGDKQGSVSNGTPADKKQLQIQNPSGSNDEHMKIVGVLLGFSEPETLLDCSNSVAALGVSAIYLRAVLECFAQPAAVDLFKELAIDDVSNITQICEASQRELVNWSETDVTHKDHYVDIAAYLTTIISDLNTASNFLGGEASTEGANNQRSHDQINFSSFLWQCVEVLGCVQRVRVYEPPVCDSGLTGDRQGDRQEASVSEVSSLDAGASGTGASGSRPAGTHKKRREMCEEPLLTEQVTKQEGSASNLSAANLGDGQGALVAQLAKLEQENARLRLRAKDTVQEDQDKASNDEIIHLRKVLLLLLLTMQALMRFPVRSRQGKIFISLEAKGFFKWDGSLKTRVRAVDDMNRDDAFETDMQSYLNRSRAAASQG